METDKNSLKERADILEDFIKMLQRHILHHKEDIIRLEKNVSETQAELDGIQSLLKVH